MDDWIVKVCRELGMSEDACEKTRQECKSTVLHALTLAIVKRAREEREKQA